tara:strand:+ start:7948 stop:8367 length:420 start_codon:yes stop_codon:yes gene_type:complete
MKRKIFNIELVEGDALIRLRQDKVVELIFAEDVESLDREMSWPDHEVYKMAVQFALMIDSFFKNGEGLDNLVLNSPTGNIAAELLTKELLPITLAGIGILPEQEEDEVNDTPREKHKNNILDLTNKLKSKKEEDNDAKE